MNAAGPWISVKDDVPVHQELVLVRFAPLPNADLESEYAVGWFRFGTSTFETGHHLTAVTHWAEILPPEEE